jgi:hypothetical protein
LGRQGPHKILIIKIINIKYVKIKSPIGYNKKVGRVGQQNPSKDDDI